MQPDGGPSIDSKGYWSTGALNAAAVSVLPAGIADGGALPLVTGTMTAATGAVLTLALIGESPATDAGTGTPPLQLLQCVDNAGTVGLCGSCKIVSQ